MCETRPVVGKCISAMTLDDAPPIDADKSYMKGAGWATVSSKVIPVVRSGILLPIICVTGNRLKSTN